MRKRNPKRVVNPAVQVLLHVDIRERGSPRRRYVVDAARHPAQAAALLIAATADSAPAPRAVKPEVPLSRALLRWAQPESPDASKLFVRPDLAVQLTADRPGAPGLPLFGDFPSEPPLLWVQDPGTGMWAAYRASPRLLESVLRLRDGRMKPSSLSPTDLGLLTLARILVPRHYRRQRSQAFGRALAAARRSARKSGFAVLPGLLQPLQLAQLRRHVAALRTEGYFSADIHGSDKRLTLSDDVVATFVHRQSAAVIRSVTRELVVPAFNFTISYREGAELEPHIDRTLCAWNVSCLIESGHADVQGSWPLNLEALGRTYEIRLDRGDALLYRGDQVRHWRHRAGPGEGQSLLLLYYSDIRSLGDRPA